MEKSIEKTFQDQNGGKDDSRKNKKSTVVASSKLGAARCSNRDKVVGPGHRLDKSQQQSNMTQVSKLHQAPAMKKKFQKPAVAGSGSKSSSVYNSRSKNLITDSAGPGTKSSSVYNLRSKTPITGGAGPGTKSSSVHSLRSKNPVTGGAGLGTKSSSVHSLMSKNLVTEGARSYNLSSKTQKTEDQNASINSHNRKPPQKDSSKGSSVAMQKTEILKNSTKPIKKIETPKPLSALPADLDKKNHPLTSQHELFLYEPIYHIRWKDEDVKNRSLGYNCILCNKDLSRAAEDDDDDDDDDSEYDDDFQYDIDDDEYHDEYDLNPPLLPSVDILSCGHAYHTDCLQQGTPKEQLSDPQCILCHKSS